MLKSMLKVTRAQKDLIEVIEDLHFGEIYGLEIPMGEVTEVAMISRTMRSFILATWDGLTKIDVLHVHQGEPVLAEVDYKRKGFRCRKKYKFPTD